jgi:hypothetical protein
MTSHKDSTSKRINVNKIIIIIIIKSKKRKGIIQTLKDLLDFLPVLLNRELHFLLAIVIPVVDIKNFKLKLTKLNYGYVFFISYRKYFVSVFSYKINLRFPSVKLCISENKNNSSNNFFLIFVNEIQKLL